jgi:hypothetical protein
MNKLNFLIPEANQESMPIKLLLHTICKSIKFRQFLIVNFVNYYASFPHKKQDHHYLQQSLISVSAAGS